MKSIDKIPNGWEETTLGDVCEIKYGKDHKNLDDGVFPCYGSGGIMRYVDTILYDKPSVLIPRKGTLSNLFYINEPFWTVDTLFYTKINDEKVLPIFLFYKLKTYNLENLNVGSAVPSLTTAVLNQFPFETPKNINEQKAIAKILTAFDDKIELLQAQNKTLETTAQTIFKEWFGKYQIGDELPEGWRVGKLGEEFDIIMGQSPSGSSYNKNGNGMIFFQGRAEFKSRFPEIRLFTTEPKRIAQKFDVLVSVRAPVGDINVALEQCCIGRGLAAVSSNNPSYTLYKLKALKPIFDIFEAEGTVFGSINKKSFAELEVIVPSKQKIKEFELLVSLIDLKIYNNAQQIQSLTKTRDTLLPKVMSGQVRVKM